MPPLFLGWGYKVGGQGSQSRGCRLGEGGDDLPTASVSICIPKCVNGSSFPLFGFLFSSSTFHSMHSRDAQHVGIGCAVFTVEAKPRPQGVNNQQRSVMHWLVLLGSDAVLILPHDRASTAAAAAAGAGVGAAAAAAAAAAAPATVPAAAGCLERRGGGKRVSRQQTCMLQEDQGTAQPHPPPPAPPPVGLLPAPRTHAQYASLCIAHTISFKHD